MVEGFITPSLFTIYILRSASTGHFYIGQTEDLERRLKEHEQGLARYTRGRGPWRLVLTEEHLTRSAAMRRERFLKSGGGREWLKQKIREDVEP